MEDQQLGNSPLAPSVLIVDDGQDIREVLHTIIEDAGYLVLEARDGVEALDILHIHPVPRIVLTDHQMPRLDGPGLLHRILQEPAFASGHAYVYMTAGSRNITPVLQKLLMALAVTVLFKPLNMDELLATLGTAAHHLCTSA